MTELRATFDVVAEIYDRVRPTYPPALFEEMFAWLPKRPVILEIGPGTGQATGALLERDAEVTAVELGPRLAELLQRKYQDSPHLRVIVAPFEDADLFGQRFDAIVSATAFHWIPADLRLERCLAALRPGGWLALIETVQVAACIDRGFFARAQPIYERYGDATTELLPEPDSASSQFLDELQSSASFLDPTLFRFRWDQTYPTASYIDLMRSYSVTQAMSEPARGNLLRDMASLIDLEYGGVVTRPLVITLTMARVAP